MNTFRTICGDPHAKQNNIEDRIRTLFGLFEDLGHPVDILGDLMDGKEIIRGNCLNTLIELFQASKLQFRILVGNHDLFNIHSAEHSLEALKLLPNVKIIDAAEIIDGIAYIPYIHDKDKLRAELGRLPDGITVICHMDLLGFDYGNGVVSLDGIDPEELKRFKLVISGHYHKFQVQGNILYLGTPFTHTFGESGQTKYIGVLDQSTMDIQFYETPFAKHLTHSIDCDHYYGEDSNLYDTKFDFGPTDYHRVILTGQAQNIAKFPKGSYPGVKFIEMPSRTLGAARLSETDSNEQKFQKWAKEIKNLDKATIALGLKFLKGEV